MSNFINKPVKLWHLIVSAILILVLASAGSGEAQSTAKVGPQGPQGEQGPAGPKGDTGERGPRGKAGKRGESAPTPKAPTAGIGGGGSTITDGTWEVGKDIQAGTYRAEGGDTCYWEIRKSANTGDNLDDILENGAMDKNPTVTLSAGQWFNTQDCGDWK